MAVLPACQHMYLHTSVHPVHADMIRQHMYLHTSVHPVHADMIRHQRFPVLYCRPSENGRQYYCNIMCFVLLCFLTGK